MITKFIDANGTEQSIDSIAKFVSQVEAGAIGDNTMIYCGDTSSWKKAAAVEDYLSVKSRLLNSTPKQKKSTIAPIVPGDSSSFSKKGFKAFLAKKSTAWLFTIIAIALLYYSESSLSVGETDPTGRLAYLFGKYLVILLIGGAVLQKTLYKGFKPSNFISFATALLCAAIIHTYMAYEDKLAAKSFAKDMSSYLNDTQTTTSGTSPKATLSPTAHGLNVTKDILKQHIEAQTAAANAYSAAVEKLPTALEPQTLSSKVKIQSALQTVDRFESAIYTYFENAEKIQNKTKEKVNALAIDSEFKSEFIAGMDKSYKAGLPLMERFKKNQLAIARKMREILSFASKSNVQLSEENQPLFATNSELEYYNSMIEDIQKLAAEEEQITKEIAAVQEQNQQKLEKLAKE